MYERLQRWKRNLAELCSRGTLVPLWWLACVATLGIIAKQPYRRFVQARAIDDFGLSQLLPSFLFPVFAVLLLARTGFLRPALLIGLIAGTYTYELSQLEIVKTTLPALASTGRTFDVLDMVGITLGYAVALALLRAAARRNESREAPASSTEHERTQP